MQLEKILDKLYRIKNLKQDINRDIKENRKNINMDKLEFFDFIHKVEKLDLMINDLIDEVNKNNSEISSENYEKEEKNKNDEKKIIKKFNIDNTKNEDIKSISIQTPININLDKIDIDTNDIDTKEYKIGNNKNENMNECEISDKPTNSIEEAYKRIAKLENLMNQRRFIEKNEETNHMKDIHSKEERDTMLEKRKIVAQTFTSRARENKDDMDHTVAMSKEEFYNELNKSQNHNIKINSFDNENNDYEKNNNYEENNNYEGSNDYNLNYENKKNDEVDMDHTAILNFNVQDVADDNLYANMHGDDEQEDEEDEAKQGYYDIYNEEKSNGLFEKVKDFLGK